MCIALVPKYICEIIITAVETLRFKIYLTNFIDLFLSIVTFCNLNTSPPASTQFYKSILPNAVKFFKVKDTLIENCISTSLSVNAKQYLTT